MIDKPRAAGGCRRGVPGAPRCCACWAPLWRPGSGQRSQGPCIAVGRFTPGCCRAASARHRACSVQRAQGAIRPLAASFISALSGPGSATAGRFQRLIHARIGACPSPAGPGLVRRAAGGPRADGPQPAEP